MIPRDRSVGVLLALFVLAGAGLGARQLVHLDSVPLALALEHQDLRLHQPQPPGFILHVWLAQVVHAVAGKPVLALRCVSLIILAAAAVLVYRLALLVADRAAARWSLLFFVTSPLVLFHAMTSGTAPGEALAAAAAGFLVRRALARRQRELRFEAYMIGLLAGLRPTTLLVGLPLLVWGGLQLRLAPRAVLVAALAWLLGTLCWLVPQAKLAGGLDDYARITLDAALPALDRAAWSLSAAGPLAALVWGAGPLRLAAVALARRARRGVDPAAGFAPGFLLAATALPALSMLFFALASSTYALALWPVLCIAAGRRMRAAARWRTVSAAAVFDLLFFFFVPTPSTHAPDAVQESATSIAPAPDRLHGWWRALPAGVHRASDLAFARTDFFYDSTRHPEFEDFVARLRVLRFMPGTLLLGTRIVRAACFELPEATVLHADPLRPLPFLRYRGRAVRDVQRDFVVPQEIAWILLEGDPGRLVFQDPLGAPLPMNPLPAGDDLHLFAIGDGPLDAWFVIEAPGREPLRLHLRRDAPPADPGQFERAGVETIRIAGCSCWSRRTFWGRGRSGPSWTRQRLVRLWGW